ncbi:hypothetical protein Ahy_A04g018890 [Arachis hypogaea]|uniref:Ubiquitin-like protease family profile domain-containing protein n=1 Tax=Arachis hypogaea TaxID=3818 RepID=A0A445DES3_ARAHY|nr:hypothetical protein Ahy_A04g018890 [Arachis hypogaea]
MSAEIKEKCYLWATRIRTYADDSTDEYDALCTLNVQQPLVLSRVYFASLKATSHIKADIVTAMCLILNQQNIKRLQEEIFCLPPNIVLKSKEPFNVEDYPMFIPFLNRKKLASHPYIFAPVCYSEHWWMSGCAWLIYDCVIYVMKWLEIIESQNVKVDHFRVEFASRILFHDMNRDRDASIKGSERMRLSKPSAALLSPYCQVDSYDIDSDSD